MSKNAWEFCTKNVCDECDKECTSEVITEKVTMKGLAWIGMDKEDLFNYEHKEELNKGMSIYEIWLEQYNLKPCPELRDLYNRNTAEEWKEWLESQKE